MEYKIKSGDTLSEIAKSKGITLRSLLAANPQIKNANKIRVGQKINIPSKSKIAGAKSDNPYKKMSKTQMSMLDIKNKDARRQEAVTRGMQTAIKQGGETKPDKADPRGEKKRFEEKKARAKKAAAKRSPAPKKKTESAVSGANRVAKKTNAQRKAILAKAKKKRDAAKKTKRKSMVNFSYGDAP